MPPIRKAVSEPSTPPSRNSTRRKCKINIFKFCSKLIRLIYECFLTTSAPLGLARICTGSIGLQKFITVIAPKQSTSSSSNSLSYNNLSSLPFEIYVTMIFTGLWLVICSIIGSNNTRRKCSTILSLIFTMVSSIISLEINSFFILSSISEKHTSLLGADQLLPLWLLTNCILICWTIKFSLDLFPNGNRAAAQIELAEIEAINSEEEDAMSSSSHDEGPLGSGSEEDHSESK